MKDFLKGFAVITAALLIFPALPYFAGKFFKAEDQAVEAAAEINMPKETGLPLITEVKIYDAVSEREITVTAEEYVASALAAQLSPTAEPELLKAQAVVMYTYILKRRLDEEKSPTPELYGCDISTDSSKYPRLALNADESFDLEPFRNAAKAVVGEYCAYDGEPITAAYCFSAGTTTESAETVLGVDIPYLKSVPTGEPDGYISTVTYTSDEVFARLTTADGGYVLLGDPGGWIGLKETAESGYVKSLYLDSRFIVSGSEFARLMNLPSARFTFRYSPATDRFTFSVSGSGSLAGLSLRGGNALAQEGLNYREILSRFFPGTEIMQAEEGKG